MARQANAISNIRIPLAKINEILGQYPNISLTVTVKSMREIQNVLGVNFGIAEIGEAKEE
jgi:hypothetical protein